MAGVSWVRAMKIIRHKASSATALEFCPGVFMTTMPLAVAAARSTLSNPAPARTTILSLGAAAITSSVTLSERMMRASASATAATKSLCWAYFSSLLTL